MKKVRVLFNVYIHTYKPLKYTFIKFIIHIHTYKHTLCILHILWKTFFFFFTLTLIHTYIHTLQAFLAIGCQYSSSIAWAGRIFRCMASWPCPFSSSYAGKKKLRYHTIISACFHTYIHACTHIHINVYIHTYIHTYRNDIYIHAYIHL